MSTSRLHLSVNTGRAHAALAALREVPQVLEVALTTEALFKAYGALVGRWALRLGGPLLRSEDAAEDVVQEVFLIVARTLPSYRPEAKVTTWLFAITTNVVRQQRWRARFRRLWTRPERAAEVPSRERTPEAEALRRETGEQVQTILDQLSERHRTVLVLYEWEQLSGEEIAERLGLNVGTVFVTLHRARAAFVSRMKALEAREGMR